MDYPKHINKNKEKNLSFSRKYGTRDIEKIKEKVLNDTDEVYYERILKNKRKRNG